VTLALPNYQATKSPFCQSHPRPRLDLDLALPQEQNSRHHSFWLCSEEFLLCLRSSSSPFLMRTCPGCSQVSPRCLATILHNPDRELRFKIRKSDKVSFVMCHGIPRAVLSGFIALSPRRARLCLSQDRRRFNTTVTRFYIAASGGRV